MLKISKKIQEFTKKDLINLLDEKTETIENFLDKMKKIELIKEIEELENKYGLYDKIYYTYYHIKANEDKIRSN